MRFARNDRFPDTTASVRALARSAPIGIALVAVALWLSAWPALAEKYYIRKQGQVFEINETYAQQLVPDYWWIYYFKQGTNPSANSNDPGHWGSDFNKDLGKLLEDVKKHISFDKAYRNEWFCNYTCKNNPYVYDNYFGPIAVISANDPNRLPEMPAEIPREITRAKELASQLLEWCNNFLAASHITSFEDVRTLAAKSVEGQVRNLDPAAIQGMLQNLKSGIEGLGKLQAFMNNVGAQADQINQQLASVADDLKAASQTALKIKVAAVPSPKADYTFVTNNGDRFTITADGGNIQEERRGKDGRLLSNWTARKDRVKLTTLGPLTGGDDGVLAGFDCADINDDDCFTVNGQIKETPVRVGYEEMMFKSYDDALSYVRSRGIQSLY